MGEDRMIATYCREEIDLILPFLLPALQKALDRGVYSWSAEAVLQEIREGRAFALISGTEERPKAFSILTFVETLKGLDLHVLYSGGELEDLMAQMPPMEELAREMGCQRAIITGRPGWDKVLRPFGFERKAVILSKSLERIH